MNAYENHVPNWNENLQMGIITTDLDRIAAYLEAGWTVLGWQNQSTIKTDHPYAIGGGVAKLLENISATIQTTLLSYRNKY